MGSVSLPRIDGGGQLRLVLAFAIAVSPIAVFGDGHRIEPPRPSPPPVCRSLWTCARNSRARRSSALNFMSFSALDERPPQPGLVEVVSPELQAGSMRYLRQFESERAVVAGVRKRIADAMGLVHRGRPEDAVAELFAIETEHPGLHQTAVSLSFAYEWAKKLDEAVLWIAHAIKRHLDVVGDTAWLQLAILQAKRKLRDDDAWRKDNSVLGDVTWRNAGEIARAIEFQLRERLPCAKPLDAVMCDLFFEAGDDCQGGML
jgi:hypothetical protein